MSQPGFVLEPGTGDALLRSGEERLRIRFVTPSIVRVTFTRGREFVDRGSSIVVDQPDPVAPRITDERGSYLLATDALAVRIDRATGALSYHDAGGALLVREPARGGRRLVQKAVYRSVFDPDPRASSRMGVDGVRGGARASAAAYDREAFEATLELELDGEEAIFGLGSHEDGYANLRGCSRDLYQHNLKAVVPHLVSSRGYGILLDCGCAMRFRDDGAGAWWWADCVEELDLYLIYGGGYSGVLSGYRRLTGPTPLPPRWAFGYIQSKERYVTGAEMVAVVAEYRRREIPLDAIVLDWKSWPSDSGWGQKSLDPVRFPDPDGFIEELHRMHARLMVSIWPTMTGACSDRRELSAHGWMLGNGSTYNPFLPEARRGYWEQAKRGLFAHGVDAWWSDATEPFEADWAGAVKPGPELRLLINTEESKRYLDPAEINLYSLLHAQGIYEGQRSATDTKRVFNLTRSSYAGQHRYGTVTWNGDVPATWESLARSIAEGLNFCATGEAYWTVDAGGFFIASNPDLWFWRGDYAAGCRGLTALDALEPDRDDRGCTDPGFHELYLRWLQYAAFLPVLRSHGTDAAREIWRFGEPGGRIYDAIADCIRLRYRLLPYIYSLAAALWREGAPLVHPLALAFPCDRSVHPIRDQYLFGAGLMVCPVTRPASDGLSLDSRPVYLPAGQRWYDGRSGEALEGGTTIEADAPLESIPWFLQAGSILPMAPPMQYVDQLPGSPLELRVYGGADAAFALYEDEGDGYAYERGDYAITRMGWDEERRELVIEDREGEFPGLVRERDLSVRLYSPSGVDERRIRYRGGRCSIPFGPEQEQDQEREREP